MRWKIPLVVFFFGFYMAVHWTAVFSSGTLFLNEFMVDPVEGNEWVEIYYQGGD